MNFIIEFYASIYRFYNRYTDGEETAKIQTIGLVSIMCLFSINFIISMLFYHFKIPLNSVGHTTFIIMIMTVFTILTYGNVQVFNKNKDIITKKGGSLRKGILTLATIIIIFILGFYSFELYRLSNMKRFNCSSAACPSCPNALHDE